MQSNQFPKGFSSSHMKTVWNNMAPLYNHFDPCMQTFYYTLTNMLQLHSAKSILQIACGTCKMVPYALSLKSADCTYLATDLSENMVKYSKEFLSSYIKKLGVDISLQEWMEKHKLGIQVHNGQQVIEGELQFDRIICNLVLMLSQQPEVMMKSLHHMASKGCLLGATVWGDKNKSNFFPVVQQAHAQLGRDMGNPRSNFFLFNNLQQLGKKTGWEVLLIWQQNAPLNFVSLDDPFLQELITAQCNHDKQVIELVKKNVRKTFEAKKPLNFPVQMAIFRKI